MSIYIFQDRELTLAPVNPDFTFCFKNSILIWTPCALLWIFAPLDIFMRYKSRYSHIPISILNISKFFITSLLVALSTIDLAMMITVEMNGIEKIYGVQFVSIGVKILTFVSNWKSFYFKGHNWSALLCTWKEIYSYNRKVIIMIKILLISVLVSIPSETSQM